jgi:uncharacterized protein YciI
MNTENAPGSGLTEQDLLRRFEEHLKSLKELEAKYNVPPIGPEPARDTTESRYITEALFFYRVHAST